MQVVERLVQPGDQLARQRIPLLWAVERDRGGRPVNLRFD
jgi:hypothetical protein